MASHQLFWIASRAFGTIAMILLGITVTAGAAMSGRMFKRRGATRKLRAFHEAATLVTLGLIVAHGGLLLLDPYLRPGLAGVAVPFVLGYRTVFTGVGIVAGWLAGIFALSFYVRRRIGTRLWRRLHRFTIVVYLLAVIHVLGAGTDATSPWMLAVLTSLAAPIAYAVSERMLGSGSTRHKDHRNRPNVTSTPNTGHHGSRPHIGTARRRRGLDRAAVRAGA
jgi:sulfoxide reductase heme-binding subunit YedZ